MTAPGADQARAHARHHAQHVAARRRRAPCGCRSRASAAPRCRRSRCRRRSRPAPVRRREDAEEDQAEARLGVGELPQIVGQRAGHREGDAAVHAPRSRAARCSSRAAGSPARPDQDAALERAGHRVGDETSGRTGSWMPWFLASDTTPTISNTAFSIGAFGQVSRSLILTCRPSGSSRRSTCRRSVWFTTATRRAPFDVVLGQRAGRAAA